MNDRRRTIYLFSAMFVSMVIMGVVTLLAVRSSERKFCNLMVLLDDGYNAPVQPGQPPLTERGQRIAAAVHELRESLPNSCS